MWLHCMDCVISTCLSVVIFIFASRCTYLCLKGSGRENTKLTGLYFEATLSVLITNPKRYSTSLLATGAVKSEVPNIS